MNRSRWFVLSGCAVLGVIGGGCGRGPGRGDAEEALLEADRRFAANTAARGADGWAEAFLENGVMFPPAGRVDGREAIRDRMVTAFAPDRPRLRWEPTQAVAAASTDLGYTLGRWKRVVTQQSGEDTVLAEGNYVSIWKLDADGRWRVAVDIGNSDPTPGASVDPGLIGP